MLSAYKLYLYNNKLTSVDLSSCKSLGSLAIYTNSLTSLDVTPCAAECTSSTARRTL